MYKWPDGWKEAVLADLGVEKTPFLMAVLQAWQQSTPLDPYTNNPLGMPFKPGVNSRLLNTGYGMFASMPDFRRAFVLFVNGGDGYALHQALLNNDSYAPAYRAIHGLGWPANATETDYPSAVLDLVSESTRTRLQTTDPADRTTSGTVGYSAAQQGGIAQLGNALQRAATAALGAANALR